MSESQPKRAYCPSCQRPNKGCICSFARSTQNKINVLVLQHPSEVKQTKGTVSLLAQSLARLSVVVGEDFSDNEIVASFIAQNSPCYLLYPNENAKVISVKAPEAFDTNDGATSIKSLIIIDGTWKKAYRIYQLSKNLHQLPSFVLPEDIECLYQIRKTKKKQALSSYEATIHALALLEQDQAKYHAMRESFIEFNQFQLAFTPSHHQ